MFIGIKKSEERLIRRNNLKLNQEEQNQIVFASVQQIHQYYEAKKYTVEQVLLCYAKNMIIAGSENFYICDISFSEALNIAKNLDLELKRESSMLYHKDKPLFGIPITLKDTFIAPGTFQSFGCVSRCKQRSNGHGIQSFLIESAGGIIIAKTNMPQFGFSFESENHVFGRSIHPTHPDRSQGGSTGGEAGLLIKGGTLIGVGSDSGGSIRIPCHFCGVWGYKPSSKRLCMRGQAKNIGGWDGIRYVLSCYGPMTRTFEDLIPLMEAFTNQQNYNLSPISIKDINFHLLPFNRQACFTEKKLKIGVLRGMNLMLPSKANQRALQIAANNLRKQGHQVFEFDVDQNIFNTLQQIMCYVILGEGGMRSAYELYEGEPFVKHFDNFVAISHPNIIVRRINQFWLWLNNRKRELQYHKAADHPITYYESLHLTAELAKLQVQMAVIWDQLQIDGVISPVSAGVAVKHFTAKDQFSTICYTFAWNLLDYSAGSVPITKVLQDEQFYDEPSKFGVIDNEYRALQDCMRNSIDLPVGIQMSCV
ncbi:hypothetical protein pb186bvf_012163 [Paramecium bursaria]